jgi:mannose/cellobiose epimerase-like protein (N-acyl-D-glucosamine 2-epimerase family)
MISFAEASRLANALAEEIGHTIPPGTAGLVEELVRRPGVQGHRSILLGHETGWIDLVWRALEVAELADLTEEARSD